MAEALEVEVQVVGWVESWEEEAGCMGFSVVA